MARIAIAGISHETNTYAQGLTGAGDFYRLTGERLLARRGTETDVGGALDACAERGFEAVPILVAGAQPSGTIEASAYAGFKQDILDGLEAAGPLDAVFLSLHGAGVVEAIPDLEGDLARAVRRLVGEAVPVVAVFDLHGNVTQEMADALDGVFACHQYPHIDLHLRAIEAIDLIAAMLTDAFRPTIHVEAVPVLLPTTTTFHGVGEAFLAEVLAAENDSDVIDVSWFHGFPYADVPQAGSQIVVTTRGDREAARDIARRLARTLWARRGEFLPERLSAAAAVARAQSLAARPVVINETSDNCGGGTPGDGTHLLRAMLEAGLQNATFGFIVDPEVAGQAHRAGVGQTIDGLLGGKTDDLHGAPLALNAYVKSLHDGRLTMLAMAKGAPLNLGPLARLVVDGIDIIVASRRSQTFDVGPFLAVGIDVRDYDIVALKSSNHFRAGFEALAGAIVTADPPGLSTHDVTVFEHATAAQPLWPIDPAASYLT
ncbi:MAG: M81 family metallopeptidase [Pseudomonadota bacterium]